MEVEGWRGGLGVAATPDRHTAAMESTARRPRRWPLLLAAGGLLAVAAGVLVSQGAGRGEVHPLPPPGGVAAVTLDGGQPVFIAHGADGAVRAFDARAPVHAGRRRGLLLWCEPNEVFIDPLFGHSWEADGTGRVLRGTMPRSDLAADRPPPALARVPVEASQGVVRLTPPPRSAPPVEWPRPSAEASCPAGAWRQPAVPGQPASVSQLAGDAPPDGVWRFEARLEETAAGAPRLCPQGPLTESCGAPALELALPPPEWLPQGLRRRRRVRVALTVEQGRASWLLVAEDGPGSMATADDAASADPVRGGPPRR